MCAFGVSFSEIARKIPFESSVEQQGQVCKELGIQTPRKEERSCEWDESKVGCVYQHQRPQRS